MAVLPKFLEGAAFGVLNDVLSEFRSNEGYATPNRYEVAISRPAPSFTGTSQNQSRGLVYDTNHSTYEKNYILDMLLHIGMGLINYNELKELLKNLKIKGRTKLILWKTYEGGDWETTAIRRKQAIAHAIMKSNN